jgi:serine/threonine protein kinase
MDQDNTLTKEDWRQVRIWFEALIDCPAMEVTAQIHEVTSDERLQRMLMTMLDVYHGSAEQTITPKKSATNIFLEHAGFQPGEHFTRYQIVRTLGSGGMGQVYLAQRDDEVLQRVAIKVLNKHLMDEQMLARFDAERRILASLEHPNIARLIDAGSEDGQAYYVMEFVDGMPVDQFCQQNNLSLSDRLSLFLQICDAVACAHSQLIVHRDLKPGNILVTNQGDVKLLDFGIAKPLKTLPGTDQLHETIAGSATMTPQYAAPEQISGQTIGVSCDVYGLGLLLYRLLTDQHAFELEGKTWGEIERVINELLPTLPSRLLSRLPKPKPNWQHKLKGDLDAIVSHALKKEPGQRYQGVRELAADIEHYLNNEPLQIKHKNTLYRFQKNLRKHWFPISALTIVFGVLVISSLMIWQQAQVIADERDKALTEKQVAEEVTDFLINTFQSADPAQAKSSQLTVSDVLESGINNIHTNTNLSGQVKDRFLITLAEIFINFQKYSQAEVLLDQLADASALGFKNQLLRARIELVKIDDEAIQRALLRLTELQSNEAAMNSQQKIKVLFMTARAYELLQDTENKKKYADLMLEEAQRSYPDDSMEYANVIINYASMLYDLGQADKAVILLNQALNNYQKSAQAGTYFQGVIHKHLASFYVYELNEPNLAIEHANQTKSIFENSYGSDHPDKVELLNVLATAHMNAGNHSAAADLYQEAIKTEESSDDANELHVSTIKNNLAILYLTHLKQYSKANVLLTEVLKVVAKHKGSDNFVYQYMSISLAKTHYYLGEHQRALQLLEAAMRFFDKQNINTELKAKALTWMALNRQKLNDFQQAKNLFQQAVQLFDELSKTESVEYHQSVSGLTALNQI